MFFKSTPLKVYVYTIWCAGYPDSVELEDSIRVKLGNWSSKIDIAESLYSSKVMFEKRISVVTDMDSGASSEDDIIGDVKDRLSSLVQSAGYSSVNPRFELSYANDPVDSPV